MIIGVSILHDIHEMLYRKQLVNVNILDEWQWRSNYPSCLPIPLDEDAVGEIIYGGTYFYGAGMSGVWVLESWSEVRPWV